ncbi:MAG: 2OG-Fe(II) oxygenase [Phenylobacterium sp.]|uniref:2OG-Fe(II) oxygenase n=1 Tax=Phenylobacterium sp. TaxID=1871053 RepID=UPI00391BAF1C
MPLPAGAPAPWFKAPTHSRPDYAFSSLGGRYVLLAFLPADGAEADRAVACLEAHKDLFDDLRRVAFGVVRDPERFARLREQAPGRRWFFDPDGEISRMFELLDEAGATVAQWVLIDPMLRILYSASFADTDRVFQDLAARGDPEAHAGAPLHAPVLIVPRIFEPAICQRLIDHYEADGGRVSGVMREVDGRTVPVVDDFKKRRDADILDEAFRNELRTRIRVRLLPQIERAFQFKVTRMERYIVARYAAEEGGYFRAHRDNTTKGTAHRKFACSINLNAEAFEGGDLRFPEFGSRTYRPPTGGR